MIPKSQHTIPRMHLQHFAGSNPTGQVWTYDSLTARQWSAIPKETCVQTHFYSAERDDGTMDTRLEEHLSRVEGRATQVYDSLLKGELPQASQARLDFANFLALMYTRTTAMRRIAGEIRGRKAQIHNYAYATNPEAFDTLMRRIEAENGEKMSAMLKESTRQAMLNPTGYTMEISKESTLKVIGASDKITPLLDMMKWSLIEARHGYFITSDNPLVRVVDANTCPPIYGDQDFKNKTAVVTFPLSPRILLLMSWNDSTSDLGTVGQKYVRLANEVRAAHSDHYLFAHINDKRIARLADKFKDSRPGMTTQGFGPDKFAPINVTRRTKTGNDGRGRE